MVMRLWVTAIVLLLATSVYAAEQDRFVSKLKLPSGDVMKIVKLSHRNVNAWLEFFDNRASSDHKAWKGCYCTYYYYPRFEGSQSKGNSRRDYAKWLIENGKMNGYLVYEDGNVVGWCNVGSKRNYPKLKGNDDPLSEGTKSIVCFMIEAPYRGQGIATALLKRIVKARL